MQEHGRNLTHQLAHQLGVAIVQGDYGVQGSFPTEAELSARFNISRSVTREAVKMLTAKGLISSRPRQGIRVMPSAQWNVFDADVLAWMLSVRPSPQLLGEFTRFRAAVEPEAAALAAVNNGDPDRLGAIGQALERMRLADEGRDDPLTSDIAFHSAILLASDNRFFVQLRTFIQAALRISIANTNRIKGVTNASYADHKAVYDAICAGDGEGARRAMQRLLDEALALLARSEELQGAGVES